MPAKTTDDQALDFYLGFDDQATEPLQKAKTVYDRTAQALESAMISAVDSFDATEGSVDAFESALADAQEQLAKFNKLVSAGVPQDAAQRREFEKATQSAYYYTRALQELRLAEGTMRGPGMLSVATGFKKATDAVSKMKKDLKTLDVIRQNGDNSWQARFFNSFKLRFAKLFTRKRGEEDERNYGRGFIGKLNDRFKSAFGSTLARIGAMIGLGAAILPPALSVLENALGPLIASMQELIVMFVEGLRPAIMAILPPLQELGVAIGPAIREVFQQVGVIFKELSPVIKVIAKWIATSVVYIAKFVAELLKIKPIVYALIAAFTIYYGILLATKVVLLFYKAFVAIMSIWTTVVKVATAVQWLWNIAMSANPIGLIVLAVAALVTGIILLVRWLTSSQNAMATLGKIAKVALYIMFWPIVLIVKAVQALIKHWETVKKVLLVIGKVILVALFWPVLLAIKAVQWLARNWEKITGVFKRVWNAIKNFFGWIWQGIKDFFSKAWDFISEWFNPIRWFTKIWDMIKGVGQKIVGWMPKWLKKIFGIPTEVKPEAAAVASGKATSEGIAKGIKQGAPKAEQATEQMVSGVAANLPHSDAEQGPLSKLTQSGRSIPETMGQGVKASQNSFQSSLLGIFDKALDVISPLTSLPPLSWFVKSVRGAIRLPKTPAKPVPTPAEQAKPIIATLDKWGEFFRSRLGQQEVEEDFSTELADLRMFDF